MKGLDCEEIRGEEIRGGEGFLGEVETLGNVTLIRGEVETLGNVTFIRGEVETVQDGLDSTWRGVEVLVDTAPGHSRLVVEFVGFWRSTSSFATLAGNDT